MSIENSIGASWAPAAASRASCGRTPRGSSDPTLSDTCDRTGSAISRHRAGKANRIQRRRRRRTAALVDRRSEADRLRFLAEVASLRFELAVLRLSTRANKALHHSNFQPRVLLETQAIGSLRGHQWDDPKGLHRAYNDAVDELFGKYLSTNNIAPQRMTADRAWSFLRQIERSEDPRILHSNATIKLLRMLRIFRGRGSE
jgi:hypothetical protein